MKSTTGSVLLGLLFVGIMATIRLNAQVSERQGYFPPMGMTGFNVFQCDAGFFLVGLTENKTDRIVGVTYVCQPALPGGLWNGINSGVVPVTRLGDLTHGTERNTTCPHNFFLIGFVGTLGTYAPDTHGMATVGIDLLADLAPVCRDKEGAIFSFDSGHNDHAENNRLHVIPWDGLSGARTCPLGQAAVGIVFRYENKPGEDPNQRFSDAALLCDHLPISVAGVGGDKVPVAAPEHPTPPRP
jgi:hypothetical protein